MIYILNAALILLWNLVIPDRYENKKKWLCILCCIQWIVLSGFRAYTVGADTYSYKVNHFDVTLTRQWSYVFNRFLYYFRGVEGIKDPGYQVFEKICQIFVGGNYTQFLLIIACVFTIPMTRWIYKYSENVCMSFMIYSSLFYSFFAITGHRQTIASALVIFAGYECMKKKKTLLLLLIHFIAFFIHKSSICFLILYLARYIKINQIFWIISTAAIAVSFVFSKQLMVLFGSLLGYEDYASAIVENVGAYTFTAILLMVYFATMLFYERLPKDTDTKYGITALVLAMFFDSFTFVNPAAMRVVQYFSVFIMILIPRLIRVFDRKSQFLANSGCYMFLFLSLLIKMPNYTFIFT